MSRLVENPIPGHTDLIFPCDCHDDHYLRLSWDDSDQAWRYLWITGVIAPRGVWPRVKAASRIIFGKEYCSTEVILGPETVLAIKDFLA